MTISLDKIVKAVEELPALSHVASRVLTITEDPDANASDLAESINLDPNLAASILRLANSAYYGFARHISTVTDAIILLGFSSIKSLTIAASTYRIYNKEVSGYSLSKGEIWRHSIGCAMMSKLIAIRVKYKIPEEAYVAGLLHDIGKIIIDGFVGEEFASIVKIVEEEKISFSDAEKRVLGFDHPEIGARVAEKWNFPDKLVEAIRYHHSPEEAEVSPILTSVIHVADASCLMLGIGLGGDGLKYPLNEKAIDLLMLSEQDMEHLMSKLGEVLVDPQCFASLEGGGR